MPTLYVTGAAGFIGSHLVRRLLQVPTSFSCIVAIDALAESHVCPLEERKRRWELLTAPHASPRVVREKGDAGDLRFLARLVAEHGAPTTVVHLAALPGVRYCEAHPTETIYANVTALATLLSFVSNVAPSAHFIFASSSAVYGNQPRPWTEDTPPRPLNAYAKSKLQGEALVRCSALPFTIVRPFSVYGPDGRSDMCVDSFLRRLYAGELAEVLGDGSAERDLTFIDDVLAALCLILQQPNVCVNQTYNIGSGRPLSVASIVERLARALGIRSDYCVASRLCIFHPRTSFEPDSTHCDSSKAQRELAWKAAVTVEEGLQRTVTSFLQSRSPVYIAAVVATYATRRSLLLERCLPSILRQSRLPDAIILVDDSEQDHDQQANQLRIAATALLQQTRSSAVAAVGAPPPALIVTPNLRTRRSASGAWNTGFHLAYSMWPDRAPHEVFVAVLDDDDEWLPTHLQHCVDAVMSSAADWVVPGFIRQEPKRSRDIIASVTEVSSANAFLVGNPGVQGSNLFIRLSTFAAAGCFDENLSSCTDRDLCIRLTDLPTLRVCATGRITVRHYADDIIPRLSTPGSVVKISGLNVFWHKHSPRMSMEQREQFTERAARLFHWSRPTPVSLQPPPMLATAVPRPEPPPAPLPAKLERVSLFVGIISSSIATVTPLLEDLLYVSHAPPPPGDCGGLRLLAVRVFVLENGPRASTFAPFSKLQEDYIARGLQLRCISLEEQAADAASGLFCLHICPSDSPLGRAPIAVARTKIQTYVGAAASAIVTQESATRPLALILDDDKRLSNNFWKHPSNPCLPVAAALRALASDATIGALFATTTQAPPLPAPFVFRTTLVDHHYALLCRGASETSAQLFDQELKAAAPTEWYHDLSASFFRHLEAPMACKPHKCSDVLEALSAGYSLTRPLLPASGAHSVTLMPRVADSVLRGGATFVWQPEVLLTSIPNTSPLLRGQRTRRSDMIWALLARHQACVRTVISPDVQVHHDRSALLQASLDVASVSAVISADIRGFAAYRALQDTLNSSKEAAADELISAFEVHLEQRRVALAFSLLRVRGLLGVLAPYAFAESLDAQRSLAAFSAMATASTWRHTLRELRVTDTDRTMLRLWAARTFQASRDLLRGETTRERRLQLLSAGARLLGAPAGNAFTSFPQPPPPLRLVSVVGDASFQSGSDDAEKQRLAQRIGWLLAEAGISVLTGGEGGVMEAVAKGHRDARIKAAAATEPPVCVALLRGATTTTSVGPASDDIVIPTGMGDGRNCIIALSSVVIAIGGGSGTLSEVCLAYSAGRHVIVLETASGLTASLANKPLDARGARKGRVIIGARDAEHAVAVARALLHLQLTPHSRIFL